MTEPGAIEETTDDVENLSLVAEFIWFLRESRKWWLIPMIVLIVVLGLLAILTVQFGPLLPGLYALL